MKQLYHLILFCVNIVVGGELFQVILNHKNALMTQDITVFGYEVLEVFILMFAFTNLKIYLKS